MEGTGGRIRIFLFDLDGTLIWSGGAGVRALDMAFAEMFGLQRAMQGVSCDGKTDRAIVREVLAAHGLDSEDNISRLIESYVGHLPQTVAVASGYRVIEGVVETLEYLSADPDVICGLATGNVVEGARAKLGRADLFRYFPVGGFGSDSEDRTTMVRAGIERAVAYLKDPSARAAVIGDTPRDIEAAKGAGALAVGVATGRFAFSVLEEAGADLVIENLSQPAEWIERLQGFEEQHR